MSVPNKKLSNGMEIPMIGLGTFKEKNPEVLSTAIKAAIDAGYRHFDCAHSYFNEDIIGKTIREAIAESNGALKREDFFITSKCWNTYHSKEKVEQCLDQCLKRFGFDYVDLYLIHWPMGYKEGGEDFPIDADGKMQMSDVHYLETYAAMEEMVAKGKTKSIGLSNFNIQQVKDVLAACKIRPVCNQFEIHPNLHNNEWVDFCKKENLAVVAYAPLGSADRPWLKEGEPVPLKSEAIATLAKKYNKTPAQVILRWLIQRDIVVIPKSANPQRLAENMNIFDFKIADEDLEAFKGFTEFRFYKMPLAVDHQFYPF